MTPRSTASATIAAILFQGWQTFRGVAKNLGLRPLARHVQELLCSAMDVVIGCGSGYRVVSNPAVSEANTRLGRVVTILQINGAFS
jgi:hypothetical protein